MKIKWSTNLGINIIVICCIAVMAVLYIVAAKTSSNVILDDFSTKPSTSSDIDETLPDTISHRSYQKLQDSITTMRHTKNGDRYFMDNVTSYGMGIMYSYSCDTCSLAWLKMRSDPLYSDKYKHYYFELSGWSINNAEEAAYSTNFVEYYVEHGQPYLRKHVYNNSSTDNLDIPVKFRYNSKDQSLMIPVSEHDTNLYNIVMGAIGLTTILYYLFLVACFINFLISLSKGLVFTEGNLRRLLTIAITFLVIPVIGYLGALLIKLIFHSYFTPDVFMNSAVWKDSWKSVGMGIIFLLLYKAFRQGKALKDDQNLTV